MYAVIEGVNVPEDLEYPTEQSGRFPEQGRAEKEAGDRKGDRRSPRAWHVDRDRCETWEAHTFPFGVCNSTYAKRRK